jgi:hypothetical protein
MQAKRENFQYLRACWGSTPARHQHGGESNSWSAPRSQQDKRLMSVAVECRRDQLGIRYVLCAYCRAARGRALAKSVWFRAKVGFLFLPFNAALAAATTVFRQAIGDIAVPAATAARPKIATPIKHTREASPQRSHSKSSRPERRPC